MADYYPDWMLQKEKINHELLNRLDKANIKISEQQSKIEKMNLTIKKLRKENRKLKKEQTNGNI